MDYIFFGFLNFIFYLFSFLLNHHFFNTHWIWSIVRWIWIYHFLWCTSLIYFTICKISLALSYWSSIYWFLVWRVMMLITVYLLILWFWLWSSFTFFFICIQEILKIRIAFDYILGIISDLLRTIYWVFDWKFYLSWIFKIHLGLTFLLALCSCLLYWWSFLWTVCWVVVLVPV